MEVIAPRPYTVPHKLFPYHNFSKLPAITKRRYTIHYPKFLYLLPKSFLFGLTGDLYAYQISKYILNNIKKPDLIHARFGYLDAYGMLELKKKWKIPIIMDVHRDEEFGYFLNNIFIRRKQRLVLSNVDKILCVSEKQINDGLNQGIDSEKLVHVPLGIDINKYPPKKTEKIPEEPTIILFVGQLIKRKGLEYLINAVPKLKNNCNNNFEIIIAGEGPSKSYLIHMCNKLKVSDKIKFVGRISDLQLLDYYSISDIFVLPSLSEGQPMVIYEAMASEIVVIGTNVGGIPDQIENNLNGFIIPPRNSSEIANKISYLLNNPQISKKMGKIGRKRLIEKKWTWDGYAERVNKIYKSLIQQGYNK